MKPGRWVGSLQESTFRFQHWRRADTWFALMRRHAEAVVEDRVMEREFAENCQHTSTNMSRCHSSFWICKTDWVTKQNGGDSGQWLLAAYFQVW